jgi:hypothetical protein
MNRARTFIAWGFGTLGKALLSVLVVCSLTDVACTQGDNACLAYGVIPHRIEQIPPGTVVGNEAPRAWSYLVIKSYPRPGSGDVAQLSETTKQLASMLVTVMVASAQPEQVDGQSQYRLSRVAVGLGTRINGQDVIISPATQKRLGANLGFLARMVLDKANERQQENLVVVNSRTLALVDTDAAMIRYRQHRPVILRYALLLDPMTGRLDSLVWGIDRDSQGRYLGAFGPIEWLPPSKVQDVALDVDAREFTLGVPSELAFALTALPQGQKQIPLTDDWKAVAGQPRLTPALAQFLETKLREVARRAASTR